MQTKMSFCFAELAALADALAYLRRDDDETRRMGHTRESLTYLRVRIRSAMAVHPEYNKE